MPGVSHRAPPSFCHNQDSGRMGHYDRDTLRPKQSFGFSGSGVPNIAFVGVGSLAAIILLPQMLRWFSLIYTAITPHEGDFLGPPKRRLLWAAPFLFLMHPAPFLITGLIAVSALTLFGRMPAPWTWLLLGFYSYTAFVSLLFTLKIKRIRRARVKRGKPNQRLERP